MAQNETLMDADQNGESYNEQLNDAIESIVSHYSSVGIEPQLAPNELHVERGVLWMDLSTTPPSLKIYNPAVSPPWVAIANEDGSAPTLLQSALDNKLGITGGTRTGINLFELSAHPTPASPDLTVATKLYVDSLSHPDSIPFFVQGMLSISNNYAARLLDKAGTFDTLRARVLTAPVGSVLRIQISRLPGEITSPPDGSDTPLGTATVDIPAGSKYASVTGIGMTVNPGDVLRLDVTLVGTTTPGGNDLYVTCTIDP